MTKLLTHHTENWQPLADITIPAMKEYCERHGYEFDVSVVKPYDVYNGIDKLIQIEERLNDGDIGLVLDADCLITNFGLKVEDLLNEEHSFGIANDINGLNAGAFVIRWDDWGKKFMDYLFDQYGQPGIDCEQNSIEKYISENPNDPRIKILPHPSINSVPYECYYPSHGKIGYKEGDVVPIPTREEGRWAEGDFLLHIPGKPMADRIQIFNSVKIIK